MHEQNVPTWLEWWQKLELWIIHHVQYFGYHNQQPAQVMGIIRRLQTISDLS